jgi:hypothetical protein
MNFLLDLIEYIGYWLDKIGIPLGWFFLGVLIGQLVLLGN